MATTTVDEDETLPAIYESCANDNGAASSSRRHY
jgi:hypothetical protein